MTGLTRLTAALAGLLLAPPAAPRVCPVRWLATLPRLVGTPRLPSRIIAAALIGATVLALGSYTVSRSDDVAEALAVKLPSGPTAATNAAAPDEIIDAAWRAVVHGPVHLLLACTLVALPLLARLHSAVEARRQGYGYWLSLGASLLSFGIGMARGTCGAVFALTAAEVVAPGLCTAGDPHPALPWQAWAVVLAALLFARSSLVPNAPTAN